MLLRATSRIGMAVLCLGAVLVFGSMPNVPMEQVTHAQTRTTLFLPLASAACLPRLVFSQLGENNTSVAYTMNGDGSNKQRFSDSINIDGYPVWSPDGQRIAFVAARGFQGQIFVANADGSGQQQLTTISHNFNPVWSPDGSRIAFVSERDPTGMYDIDHIYTMNSDGSNVQRLTNSTRGNEYNPVWSSQNIIAFETGGMNGSSGIYTIDANASGSEPSVISESSGDPAIGPGAPTWSPDGTRLAFVKYGYTSSTVVITQPDGSNLVELISFPIGKGIANLSWSPDEQYFAFTSRRAGNVSQIFRMNADGSNIVQLTHGSTPSLQPSWNPRFSCTGS